MRADPRVMVALGDAEEDFDVGLIEARAELLDIPAADFLPESHWAKYARGPGGYRPDPGGVPRDLQPVRPHRAGALPGLARSQPTRVGPRASRQLAGVGA